MTSTEALLNSIKKVSLQQWLSKYGSRTPQGFAELLRGFARTKSIMAAVSIVTDSNLKSENPIVASCLRFYIRTFLDSKY
jgi:hypothetical protein